MQVNVGPSSFALAILQLISNPQQNETDAQLQLNAGPVYFALASIYCMLR